MTFTSQKGFRKTFFSSWKWVWAAFFLILWQVLLRAQNPGLMADDSGEMAAAADGLGLPHPPGYPFFNLTGHFFSWLPLGTIAFRLNLFSGALLLLSLVFILDSARKIHTFSQIFPNKTTELRREALLAVLGIIFISCRSVFAQGFTAKGCIYTLTLFLTSIVTWLYVKHQAEPQNPHLLSVSWFLWAVGMANHWQTHILWIPFLLVWCYQKKKHWIAPRPIFGVALIVIGLSLYLYLPLRAKLDCKPCWGYPIKLSLFYWVVSRQLVSGVEHWIQDATFYLKSFKEILRVGLSHWLPGFGILSLGGMLLLWKKDKWLFYGFLALFVPVFLAVFAIHEEQNIYLIPAYLVSVSGLVLLFGFVAARWIQEKFAGEKWPLVWLGALGIASLAWLGHVFELENKSRYLALENFGMNVLKTLPKGSILLAEGDHYVMPIWYECYARHLRPDLVFEPAVFLSHGWGWKQLGDQSDDLKSLVMVPNLSQDRLNALSQLPSAHPLFYSLGRGYLESALEKMPGFWIPHGLVYAWKARRSSRSEALTEALRSIRAERMSGLDLEGRGGEVDPATQQIYRYYNWQIAALEP